MRQRSFNSLMEAYERLLARPNPADEHFYNGLYTRYRNMMTQTAEILWVLPLERTVGGKMTPTIFEPGEREVLDAAVPTYVSGLVAACVRESFASEVAARRMAMDSAGKNAQEMIDRLQLEYNRARQNAITQEITEIVAGSGM